MPYDATGQPYYHDFGDGYHQGPNLAYLATHRCSLGPTWCPRRGVLHPIYRDPAIAGLAGYGGRDPRYSGVPFFDPATHPLGGGCVAVTVRDPRYPPVTYRNPTNHPLGGGYGAVPGRDPRYPTATYFDPAIHKLGGGLGGCGPRVHGTMFPGPAANGIGAVGSAPDRAGAAAPVSVGPRMGGYAGGAGAMGAGAMAGGGAGDAAQQSEREAQHPDCTCPRWWTDGLAV